MADMTEKTPGQDLLGGYEKYEGKYFDPIVTCVLDYDKYSFCDSDYECYGSNEIN